MDENQIIETWEIHHGINLYILENIKEEHLSDKCVSKGRNVGEHFAHLHHVRLMWLKAAHPELLADIKKIEKSDISRDTLKEALFKSATSISALLQGGLAQGKIKGIKPHPITFLAYLIAHESHHRGQIMLCLKQSGHAFDSKKQYNLWEWNKG